MRSFPFENAVDLPENPDDLTDEHIDAIFAGDKVAGSLRILQLALERAAGDQHEGDVIVEERQSKGASE